MSDDRKNPRRPRKEAAPRGTKRKKIAAAIKALRGRPRKDPGSRQADQQALVDAAYAIVREGGVPALTARAVAARAGTAVGSVYTAFPSLEALRLEVNAVTMRLLRDCLAGALARSAGQPLGARLIGLADAYTGFADAQPTLWAALFEPRTVPTPPALGEQIAGLFALLEDVLRDAGCAAPAGIPTLARALWAGVHGTVFLASHGSLGPVGRGDAPALVHALVEAIVGGLGARRREGEVA